MSRSRLLTVIAICAALIVIGVAVAAFVVPWPDGNHTTAVQVVQNAGVSGAPGQQP